MAVRNKPKKGKVLKIIIGLFFIYCVWNIITVQIQIKQKNKELNIIRQKCEDQLAENKEQEKMISIETNDEYIKKIARDKLDFVGPEDRVFIDISCR